MKDKATKALFLSVLLLASGGTALHAQAPVSIPWSVIAGGGSTSSNGQAVALTGTLGQYEAVQSLVSSNILLTGGFWGGVVPFKLGPTLCLTVACSNLVVTTCDTNTVTVNYPESTINDPCCTNGITVIYNPPSGTPFAAPSTNTVEVTVFDACGHSNMCSFTITVLQIGGPPDIISVPPPIPLCMDAQGCAMLPDYTDAVLVAPGSGPVTVTQEPRAGTKICQDTSVNLFVLNQCGYLSSASVPVTLQVCSNCFAVECPSNITVYTCTNGANVSFPNLTISDTCCTNGVSYSYNPPSGFFPAGTATPVQLTVTDACSNTTTCPFTVTVLAATNPVVTLSNSVVALAACCTGCGALLDYSNYVESSESTNVPYTVTQDPPANTIVCSNTTIVLTYSNVCGFVTNLNLLAVTNIVCEVCSQCITFNPYESNLVVTVCGTNPVPVFYPAICYQVNCCDNLYTWSYDKPPGTLFDVPSMTEVHLTVVTECGVSNTATMNVVVIQDTSPPVINSAPTNVSVCTHTALSGPVIADSEPWDLSDYGFEHGDGLTYLSNVAAYLTMNHPSLVYGGNGSNILIYSETFTEQAYGYEFLAPMLKSLGYQVLSYPGQTNVGQGNWTFNEGATLIDIIAAKGPFDAIFLGGLDYGSPYIINYLLPQPGAIAALQEFVSNGGGLYVGGGGGNLCQGGGNDLMIGQWNTLLEPYGLAFSAPQYTIGYNTPDGITLSVGAGTLSTVPCPVMNGVTELQNRSGTPVYLTGSNPDAQIVAFCGTNCLIGISHGLIWTPYNCGVMPNITTQLMVSGSSPVIVTQSIPAGTLICANTNVVLTASTACGEVASTNVPVTLGPACASCITLGCPTNILLTCQTNAVAVNYPQPIVNDACCTNGYTVTYNPPSGTVFPLNSSTTVEVVAADACANAATCSFNVTVLSGNCSPNCTNGCIQFFNVSNLVEYSCSNCVQVFYALGIGDTCCTNFTSLTFNPPNGTCFNQGTTPVTFTAVDACGNCNSTNFTVTVIQNTNPPVIDSVPTNIVICSGTAVTGAIIVDSDEWVLSNEGFSLEMDGAVYALNCAAYLTGGKGTNILIYSDDFSFTETNFLDTLMDAGYSVTVNQTLTPTLSLAYLSGYNAVFLGGDKLTTNEIQVLEHYICTGGGVYIAAGTANVGPFGTNDTAAAEAGQWNPLLNPFGLTLANTYNSIVSSGLTVSGSTLTVSSSSPVMAGVTNIYYSGGNDVSVIGGNSIAQVIAFSGSNGLIGVSGCVTTADTGCGVMPNATGLVVATGTSGPLAVTQSIPPGALVCSNMSVIFTIANICGYATNFTVPVTLENCTNCLSLECPSNIVAMTCSNSASVTLAPAVSGSCTNGVTLVYTLLSGYTNSGGIAPITYSFPVGTTPVTVYALDAGGNTLSTCSFTVTVLPGPGSLAIKYQQQGDNVILTWSQGILQSSPTLYSLADPRTLKGPWSDLPGAVSPYITQAVGASTFYRLRCPCLTCSNCLVLTCPTNITVTTCAACTNIPFASYVGVADNCCSNWNLSFNYPTNFCFPVNTTNTVRVVATDTCGDIATNSFQVIVLPCGSTPTNCLSLTCPGNIYVGACSNTAAMVNGSATMLGCTNGVSLIYTFETSYGGVGYSFVLSTIPFTVGSNEVTVYALQGGTNTLATCSFLVIVTNLNCTGSGAVVQWTFGVSQPEATLGAGVTLSIPPELGSGSALAYHQGATTYSSPVGNGSDHSLGANNWAVGDYFQFACPTINASGIGVAWDQVSSATGPGLFQLQYSTDGVSFYSFGPAYAVAANGSLSGPVSHWSSETNNSTTRYEQDLSSISGLANAALVRFRLVDVSTNNPSGGPVGPYGTSRVGNFTVYGGSLAGTGGIPEVTWADPAPITYGTPLGGAQLNAMASVPGTFTYSPPAGTILSVGSNLLTTIFTPTTYVSPGISDVVSVVVSPRTLTFSADNATWMVGETNPVFTGTILGALNSDNVSATWTSTATPSSPPGEYAITPVVTANPGALGNYGGMIFTNPGTGTITSNNCSCHGVTNLWWTFEVSRPSGSEAAGVAITNIFPEYGSGVASAVHQGACIYSHPSGNGSTNSFCATNWAVGDYFEFACSNVSLCFNWSVAWDQVSSYTGPGWFQLQYSFDGVHFTNIGPTNQVYANGDLQGPTASWNYTTYNPTTHYIQNCSSISGSPGVAATVWFRLMDTNTISADGKMVGPSGTSRVDNFKLTSIEIP
jgi:hypothetical protein